MRTVKTATLIIAACVEAMAEDCKNDAAKGFDAWLNCRIGVIVMATLNERDPGRQTGSPAIAQSSGSLVDRSSGTDLISTALNLGGVNTGNNSTAGTVTASWYAVVATLAHHDPLDPVYYNDHQYARRLLFTAGVDSSTTMTANSNANANTNSPQASADQRPKIAGVKFLLINKRDLSGNADAKAAIRAALTDAAINYSSVSSDVQDLILDQLGQSPATPEARVDAINKLLSPDTLPGTLSKLGSADFEKIDALLRRRIDRAVSLVQAIRTQVQTIRKRPQLSLLGQGKFHDADGNDMYRAELAFDMGLVDRLNVTLNGSFDYVNRPKIGADTRGARFAGDLQYQFTSNTGLIGRGPIMFDLAGDGTWLQNQKAAYHAQAKLTIPLFDGVDFPISFTYANQMGLIKENNIEGKFGFTFDVSRLSKALIK